MDQYGSATDVADIQQQIVLFSKNGERTVIGCIIFNILSRAIGTIFRCKWPSKAAVSLTLFIILFGTYIVIAWLNQALNNVLFARLLMISCFTIMCILVVKVFYNAIVPAVARIATSAVTTSDAHHSMLKWFKWALSLKRQIVWSVSTTSFSLLFILIIDLLNKNIYIDLASYIALGGLFFVGGHIAYWGFTAPTYLHSISNCRIHLFSFDPSKSETIVTLSALVKSILLGGSAIVIPFIITSYVTLIHISTSFPIQVIIISWYLFGLTAALFLFGYSNYFLSKIISQEKRYLLSDFQSKIEKLYDDTDVFDNKKIEALKIALELYDLIKRTPETSINFSMFQAMFASLILQSLPIIGKMIIRI